MASPTELDIFTRSLGGDRRARTELYKKFLRDSSRVCRLGAGYADLNDFLHDSFNNLLRTGHSWDKETSLSHWVETVAIWTALINERQRKMSARGTKGEIRMCAEFEGEDATRGEVLPAYAPPLAGEEDSPASRILALLNEPDKTVFRKRALEHGSWEDAATAAGKPLNTIGPIFARVVARIARFFGAPPLMDEDLVPVFARAAADPQKPEGRAISVQLDTTFYTVTPEMQKLGLSTAYEARMVTLWDTAASTTPPADALRRHLDQCHYCTDLLRALILMQQALLCPPGVEFHLCPGSFNLSNAPDMVREAFDRHLAQCSFCREERTQLLDRQAPRNVPEEGRKDEAAGAGKKMMWVVTALVVLGLGSFFGFRYFAARDNVPASASLNPETLTPTVSMDARYVKLVKDIPIDDGRILASVKPENRSSAKFVIDQFSLGEVSQALSVSSQLAPKLKDPGIQMLYAMCLYKTQLMTDGYREMQKAEAMAPREAFRCFVMFDFALMVGDRKIMDREAEHLANDPTYGPQVKAIMEKVKSGG
jgi:DNA-directed RNA polymerase specialized sigma24 family protein